MDSAMPLPKAAAATTVIIEPERRSCMMGLLLPAGYRNRPFAAKPVALSFVAELGDA
jgi:hypothetical protein